MFKVRKSIKVAFTLRWSSTKFESAALFLQLGLPSTLIRHENAVYQKRSSIRRNLKTSAFRFRTELSENDDVMIIT